MSKTDLSRRTFLKATGALGTAAAAGAGVSFAGSLASGSAELAHADQEERIVWSHCHVNCGGACVLRFHMQGDEIKYVETDNTGSAEFGDIQMRACLRGRSIRRWIDHPDRLNYPLKRREGTKRGEGVYDQITWDEALDTIASEFTRIKETYGNESIFIQECSGVEQNIMMNSPFFRLFNLLGGEVTRYGNYSNAAINFGSNPFTYGDGWGRRSFKSLQKGQPVPQLTGYGASFSQSGKSPGECKHGFQAKPCKVATDGRQKSVFPGCRRLHLLFFPTSPQALHVLCFPCPILFLRNNGQTC